MTRVLSCVMLTLLVSGAVARAQDDVPEEIRKELVKALQGRAEELLKDKDADGQPYKRGTYSKFFKKIDDSNYAASFLQDTIIGKDQLKVERFAVTISKSGDGWKLGEMKLEDTFDNLYRTVPRDDQFKSFQSFHYEREGLKVDVGPGSVIVDTWRGKPYQLLFAGSGLRYEFKPPQDVTAFQAGHVWQAFMEERDKAPDLVFTPENVWLQCDVETCAEMMANNFAGLTDTTVDALPSTLRAEYEKDENDSIEARKDNPFGGFSTGSPYVVGGFIGVNNTDPSSDHRFHTIMIKRSGQEHWFVYNHDNWSPWEVVAGCVNDKDYRRNRFPIVGYYSEETRKSGVSESDLERRSDPGDRDFELSAVGGTVELALKDDEAMDADVTFTINALRDIEYLPFFIASTRSQSDEVRRNLKTPNIRINALEDDKGRQLTYVRLGGNYSLVKLAEPLKAGQSIKIHTSFSNGTAIYKHNFSYSGLSRGGWLPFVRFGDMIPEFELTIKVPKQYKVIGIGKRISDKIEGEAMVSHWKANFPVTFPTIIFGIYEEAVPTEPPKRLNGTEIPLRIHVDTNGMTDWEIRPKQLVPVVNQAAQSMKLFAYVYQRDYPYDELNLVNDPLGSFYGQSPASIIYLGSGVFRGAGFLESAFEGSGISKFNKDVVAHEVAHQWWGSLITNANQRNYWFVESMAELSSALYVEKAYGPKAYLEKIDEWRRTVVERNLMQGVQSAAVLDSGDSFGSYQAAVYNKGPLAMHILRKTFGDEKFFTFLRQLVRDLQGKEITTTDMQRVSEKVYGGDMDWFWEQWIRGAGVPEYKWSWTSRQTEDGQWLVEGKILQRVVIGLKKHVMDGVTYKALIPLHVYLPGSDKPEKQQIFVEGAETPFRFKLAKKPSKIEFAADNEVLASAVTTGTTWDKK